MTRKSTIHILITLVAVLLYIPFLGAFHLFDWDEINFAEAAREMLVTRDWGQVQIGFETFWEKPPLFIWLQAISMKLFGVNEFAARLPNALCGIVTLNILYHYGRKILSHFAGLFWVLAYAGSLAPSLYFQSGIIDPVFNLFIFLSIYQLYLAETANMARELPRINYLLAGIFAGLAFLTKGPVALLIIGLIVLVRIIYNARYAWPGLLNILLFLIACFSLASAWVIPELIRHGYSVLGNFMHYQLVLFKGQIEWHNQPWFYHLIVLFFLCFPASVFALPHLFRNTSFSGPEKLYASYMRATFWVVLILFSIVTTKIIHYSSMCWIPLAWFAGITMYRKHTNRGNIPGWIFIPVILVIILISAALTLLPLAFTNPQVSQYFQSLIREESARSILSSNPGWLGYEWLLGILFALACFIWLIQYRNKPKLNANWLFIITLCLTVFVHISILPVCEKALQGEYIGNIVEEKNNQKYKDNWGYKTYAIYFYGQAIPKDYTGPWENDAHLYTDFPSPKNQARVRFLLDRVVSKPVQIYTRINYKPDYYFNDKFVKKKILGQYILWERKDISKPDMRLNP